MSVPDDRSQPETPPSEPTRPADWLDAIQPEPVARDAAAMNQTTLTAEELYLEEMRRLQLQDYRQDVEARKGYANKLFILIAVWLAAILAILIAVGFGQVGGLTFKLSDPVLLALIGSTTATVIGLFLVVVNYLFPQRAKSPPAGN